MDSEERKERFFHQFLKRVFSRSLVTFAKRVGGTAALVAGLGTLVVITLDPVRLLSPLLPLQVNNIVFIEQTVFTNFINLLNANFILLISATTILLGLGLGLLSKELFNGVKAFWRGLKASPRATLNAPARAYKRITIWRNWLLQKIDYLQSESAKWKTTFNVLKSPYSLLRAMGFSPQMAASFLVAGSVATSGVVVNETILAEKSFSNRDPGVYAASVVGQNAPLDVPTEYVEGSNTLRIDLGTTPVRDITIENVSVGTVFANSALPGNETTVIKVGGLIAAQGFTATRLEVGTFIYEKSRCKRVTFSDINAHTIIVRGNASDGQSIAPSPGTARMRSIGGGHHQADAMVTSGGMYDRIWIQSPASGINGKIGTLKLSNLYTKGGDCEFARMDIGTLIIELNETGSGTGFATKEFIIATTVTGANLTIEDNVEISISEPATISP